jgi:hypothetical protein
VHAGSVRDVPARYGNSTQRADLRERRERGKGATTSVTLRLRAVEVGIA